MFKVGDNVAWESQAGGSTTQKTGKVVYVLQSEDFISRSYEHLDNFVSEKFPNHKKMFTGFRIPGDAEIGYLIEVITGPKAKPRLYMPYPEKVVKV